MQSIRRPTNHKQTNVRESDVPFLGSSSSSKFKLKFKLGGGTLGYLEMYLVVNIKNKMYLVCKY